MERFFLSASELTHEPSDNSPGRLSGYVTKWNVLSHDRGGYRDVFRPNAFANLLTDNYNVKAYRDHNEGIYLGRSGNNLTLQPDATGLRFWLDLINDTHGRDTAVLMADNHFGGMSFGYLPDQYKWRNEEKGPIREHLSGTLVEVSVVFDPAIPFTSVELNALDDRNPEVLASLQAWLGTPRRNSAKRVLKLAEFQIQNTI